MIAKNLHTYEEHQNSARKIKNNNAQLISVFVSH